MTTNRLSQLLHQPAPPAPKTVTLTDKEIDERIARAVEAEVARRLEERERERAREEEARREEEVRRLAKEEVKREEKRMGKAPAHEPLPSGTLTPLLRRQEDVEGGELKKRLEELEQKFEHSSREVEMVDVLSPASRKRTGRAYVALARSHSEKGNLQLALELYRKAETYVPDNDKLKERIIEIEWAVKNGKPFLLSPKRPKKSKSKRARGVLAARTSKGESTRSLHSGDATVGELSSRQEASEIAITTTSSSILDGMTAKPAMTTVAPTTVPTKVPTTASDDEEGKENHRFGADALGSPPKRLLEDMQGDDSLETPPRHAKKWKQEAVEEGEEGWEGWQPPALTRGKKETC